jgi:pimeloyl-ACP methyl ester carboxylesterase
MTTVAANGIELNIEQLGPATATETVVCIHGIGFDNMASFYFTVASPLAAAGMRVIMYDLRGHGRSGRPPTGYMVDDFVSDLTALLDELAVTTPVYLVGNSFGGTVAYTFAARYPERVAGLVAIESEPPGRDWADKMTEHLAYAANELARLEVQAWFGFKHGRTALRLAKHAARLLKSTTMVHDLPASTLTTSEEIGSIRCPVLALYGEESDLAPLAKPVSELLPQTTVVTLPGLSHFILIQAPETVRDHLLRWFEENRRRA